MKIYNKTTTNYLQSQAGGTRVGNKMAEPHVVSYMTLKMAGGEQRNGV